MITHITLYKLVHANTETIEEARKVLASQKEKVPYFRDFEVGVNLLDSYRAYDLALQARFDSMEDLQAYQHHPAHVEVLKYLQGVRQSVITVDYETP